MSSGRGLRPAIGLVHLGLLGGRRLDRLQIVVLQLRELPQSLEERGIVVLGSLLHQQIELPVEEGQDDLLPRSCPELVIGRGQKRVGVPVHVNIEEIRKPEIDAQLIADNIAQQLVKRIMFRRAMKRAIQNAMRLGAQGIKIMSSGRLNGIEIARSEWYREGRVPLHTLRADLHYGTSEAKTTYGVIGIKVWIFKGELLGRGEPTSPSISSGSGVDAEKKKPSKKTRAPVISKAGDNKLNMPDSAAAETKMNNIQVNENSDSSKSDSVGGDDAATS